jgi:alkylresorcinol/alkylpyrone synthase
VSAAVNPIAGQSRPRESLAALSVSNAPTVVAAGAAFPPSHSQSELWTGFFAEHYGQAPVARHIWENCGVDRRHGVADPRADDLSRASTEARMRRFVSDGVPLGVEAIERCLGVAGLAPSEIDHLTIVTCTGYGSPGLEVGLASELPLDPRVQRLHVRDMGCYAAIPALAATVDAVTVRGGVGIVLCLELTSLHVQPPTDDVAQVVAHALFSDAAVAVAVVPPGWSHAAADGVVGEGRTRTADHGLQLVDVASITVPSDAPLMSWDVTSLGFRMGLSPEVPAALESHVAPAIGELLSRHGMRVEDVRGWAVHPGGPAILDVIEAQLKLPHEALRESRAVLREHGNCSSTTVLLVLDRMRRERDLEDGDTVIAMAFGPGLTLYAALLRVTANPHIAARPPYGRHER